MTHRELESNLQTFFFMSMASSLTISTESNKAVELVEAKFSFRFGSVSNNESKTVLTC